MSRVIDFILHLRGGAAYALVFALPALESSAFVGFLFPGELAILGGRLAFQGKVSRSAHHGGGHRRRRHQGIRSATRSAPAGASVSFRCD